MFGLLLAVTRFLSAADANFALKAGGLGISAAAFVTLASLFVWGQIRGRQ
jgi:hypothetical protein